MKNKCIVLKTSEDEFLNNAQAYDYISSAIAIFDTHREIVYCNNAFDEISQPRSKSRSVSAVNDNTQIIKNNPELLALVLVVFQENRALRKSLKIPFNSSIALTVHLILQPVIDSNNDVKFVMLSIEEESINATFLQRVKHQEKFHSLTSQIKKMAFANHNSNELINVLLTKTPFAVIILDENQQIIHSNSEAKKLLGRKMQNITGSHCTQFFNCYEKEQSCPVLHNYDRNFDEQVHSSKVSNISTTYLRHSSAIKFKNKPAVLEGFVDISEKVKFEQELVRAKVSADVANKLKSEFLSNMSHELRTPLHAILSFSRFGVKKIEGPKEKLLNYFDKIQISGETLLHLLNDLLDLSKLESGKMEVEFEQSTLENCIFPVIDEMSVLIKEKEINLVTDLKRDLPEIKLDVERIKQVIRNLLSNAIKFSPENGKVILSTFLKNQYVYFCIEDNGPGIPAEELEQVFDKFIQSSKTKTGAGGTGLGLSICREIINLHEGQIWAAKSSLGGRFLFKLPLS